MEVNVYGEGFVYGWFDWNRDGIWQHPEEMSISANVTTGAHMFRVLVPDDAVVGQSFARFRISTQTDLPPTGPAPDGEVEDYMFRVFPEPWDWGDVPAPYATLAIADGACHRLHLGSDGFLGPWPGDRIDTETDGQPDPDALGDDRQPVPGGDEDGVQFPELMPGLEAVIRMEIGALGTSGSCWIGGWIDFNADGDWDDVGENVLAELVDAERIYDFTVAVPVDAVIGSTTARFRVSTQIDLGPTGPAVDGEVEDYVVKIVAAEVREYAVTQPVSAALLLAWGANHQEWVPMVGHIAFESRYEGLRG